MKHVTNVTDAQICSVSKDEETGRDPQSENVILERGVRLSDGHLTRFSHGEV